LNERKKALKVIPIFELIREELERVERKMREVSHIEYEQLRATLDYILGSGGKRLRPALVLLSSKFYPTDMEKVTSLAAAVETLHTATLVHDDLIDNAFLRRGNPTLNTLWDSAATVLTGDYLFARAAAFAAETKSVRVVSIFAQTLMTICSGELNQIFSSEGEPPTATAKEYYYQRIYSKTASLFAASTEAGAVLSGAPQTEAQALRDYGYNLGMAFQIVDDILDFTGNEGDLGKPIGSDLRQGIITLPTICFLEAHPDNETVTRVLNSRGEGNDEARVLQPAVEMIKESGAIESSTVEAEKFAARSRDALSILPRNEYRQAMLDLADFVVERQK
jgi:geranylgeranyl pyrophosphate synthase